MQLQRILFDFSSLHLFVITPIVFCREERIRVGPDPDKDKKINPYITKFHQAAGLRPTKCQGKEVLEIIHYLLSSGVKVEDKNLIKIFKISELINALFR